MEDSERFATWTPRSMAHSRPGEECGALAAQVRAEDTHGDQLHLGREAQDDAATGRAMAVHVDALVGDDLGLAIAQLDRHALDDAAPERGMARPPARSR